MLLDNLAAKPEFAGSLTALKQQLFAALTTHGDPRISGRGAEFDAFPYARESVRNFYQRYLRGERPVTGWIRQSDFEPSFPE